MLGGSRNCNTPEEFKSRLNSRMLDIIQFNFFLPVSYPKTRGLEYVNYTMYYFTGV
jgi:hypothetical protein